MCCSASWLALIVAVVELFQGLSGDNFCSVLFCVLLWRVAFVRSRLNGWCQAVRFFWRSRWVLICPID